jgi:2-methylcitrate dehydratase PrpD
MSDSSTAQLAQFAANLRYEGLPPEVIDKAKAVLLDAVGCGLAAFRDAPRKALLATRIADDFGSRGAATVIGGSPAHPSVAALVNGMLINATDNDDTHRRALIHVGSVVVPAALASTQARAGDGKTLIAALVTGYEIAVRVGMAVMPSHYRFWHSTATNGTFGAAAAAAKAFALGPEQVRSAIGFAGTQAAGLNTFFESGDDSKGLHPGKAAMNGVLAAMLVAHGAVGPPEVLEHPRGFLAAYSQDPRPEALTAGLGSRWEILDNGFKLYPSILASHSPIGATLDLVSDNPIDPVKIVGVEVHTYETVATHFSSKDVRTSMAARLSVPYCVAAAAVDRTITQAQFEQARFEDPVIQRVLARTSIVADPDLTALYPEKFAARVVLTLDDGTQLERTRFHPKGDPNDPLSPEELRAKFDDNAGGALSEVEAHEARDVIEHIEDDAAFARFIHLISRPGQPGRAGGTRHE